MNSLSITQLQQKIALERDEISYKLLFLHFYPQLSRVGFSITGSREASEEVVSDVLLKIWSMKEGLLSITSLDSYLFRATKNTALNYLNSNKKYIRNTKMIDGSTDLQIAEDIILKNELREQITRVVKGLPPKCQMVYRLVKDDGLSYKEVASRMEISEKTVDRHLNIAMHKLVNAMKFYLN
jgi:RNA polymerase sigma-70 factor (family 1)